MAMVKACSSKSGVKNTGKECDIAMVATAMLIAVPRSVKFTDADLTDPVKWMQTLIQQRKAFPLFGQSAPIRTITNSNESDVIVTLDDGTAVFLRYGIYNRTFETTSGGFCYAQSLQSLNKSGYSLLEVDQTGQMLARKNPDGTYSGFITDFMYAPSPIMADFKSSPYKNRFQVSYSPVEIVNNGIVFSGASGLLSLMGLIDVQLTAAGVPASSTTKLRFKIETECAGTSITDLFPVGSIVPSNFVVTDTVTGVVVPISASAIVAGYAELTGTFVSGKSYTVSGAIPTTLQTNGVEGYDYSYPVDIVIP